MIRPIALCFFLFSIRSYAQVGVGVGGYVPFGPSTQKDVTGARETFSFDPVISLNAVIPTKFYGQLFLPEFAFVFNGSGSDGYSKKTMLFLADFGHRLTSRALLRYGVGTVLTTVSGDGAVVRLPNGNDTSPFYQPAESSTSWNTTINLGIEMSFSTGYALRFQTYWFSLLDGQSRKGSYSFNLIYYF